MNQPKFEFGDKVVSSCTGKSFTIDKIENDHGKYIYYGKDYPHGCHEWVLSLYQEPKKKKLYAYIRAGRFIFADFKCDNLSDHEGRVHLPAPEYDIEYPEK